MIWDVAIAGGGPAGLAAAVCAARSGRSAVVFERSELPPDKACGEGLMPSGARELSRLGVRVEESHRFCGIRYLQGSIAVEARFRDGDGLGIRRTELSRALAARARETGAAIRRGSVDSYEARDDRVVVSAGGERVEARLLVAADGLHSPLRRAAGLDGPASRGPQRFGIRRHYAVAPWADLVEVYWTESVEAYVTPVADDLVNVAFLGDRGEPFDLLLERFPVLANRLGRTPAATESRGAGPLLQRSKARHAHRLALIGDAAGYVDAITGQGLSLAFAAASALFDALPANLAHDLAPALRRYDSGLRARWRRYALPAHVLLALARRPALRRGAIRSVAAIPGAFGALVNLVG